MSERETTPDGDPAHGPLSVALADLADTMPDDPYRVDGVHAKARRLRARRRAGRVTAAVVVGAATVAALVAVRPGSSHVSLVPSSEPSPAPVSASPSCRAALAAASEGQTTPAEKVPGLPPTETAADAAKEAAANRAEVANQQTTGTSGFKGLGTVVAASDESVTIAPDEHAGGEPSELTATVSPDAELVDGDQAVTVRPALNAGDRVAFAVLQAEDGTYHLIYLGVHVAEPVSPADAVVDPAVKAANADAAAADDSPYVKGTAEVASVSPDPVTLTLLDGPLAGQTVSPAAGTDTVYTAGDQKCDDPVLAVGDVVGVVLEKGADGTYTLQYLALVPPVPPA